MQSTVVSGMRLERWTQTWKASAARPVAMPAESSGDGNGNVASIEASAGWHEQRAMLRGSGHMAT